MDAAFDPRPFDLAGWRVVVDRDAGRGPLAALAHALETLDAPLAFALAGDTPNAGPALVRALHDALGSADAAIPRTPDGRTHPLAALYRRNSLVRAAIAEIARGNASLHGAVARLHARLVPVEATIALNVNRPADAREDEKLRSTIAAPDYGPDAYTATTPSGKIFES